MNRSTLVCRNFVLARLRHRAAALLATSLLIVLLAVAALPAAAQDEEEAAANPFAGIEMHSEKVADGIWILSGAGGNIGVSAGEDGIFLIDDEWAPMTDKVLAALADIQPGPVRFVLDTHWHADHTGGNENLGGAGTLVVAHQNVRTRMSTDQFVAALDMHVPASPPVALPVVTFTDAVTFHLNGDEIHAFHVPPAHTDGDSVVHFRKADVIHAGDVVFAGFYPFIDVSSGGSVDGMLDAVGRLLDMAGPDTKIIPGHGALTDRAGLVAYQHMLRGTRDAVAALVAAGKSREATVAAKPTAPWDETWGQGFMKPDVYTGILWDSLSAR